MLREAWQHRPQGERHSVDRVLWPQGAGRQAGGTCAARTRRRLQLCDQLAAVGGPQLARPRLVTADQHAVGVGGREVEVADRLWAHLPPATAAARARRRGRRAGQQGTPACCRRPTAHVCSSTPARGPCPHLRRRRMAGHSHTSMLPSSPPSASRRPSLLNDMPLTAPMPLAASLNSPACPVAARSRAEQGSDARLAEWDRLWRQGGMQHMAATRAPQARTLREAEAWRLAAGAGLHVHTLQAADAHAADQGAARRVQQQAVGSILARVELRHLLALHPVAAAQHRDPARVAGGRRPSAGASQGRRAPCQQPGSAAACTAAAPTSLVLDAVPAAAAHVHVLAGRPGDAVDGAAILDAPLLALAHRCCGRRRACRAAAAAAGRCCSRGEMARGGIGCPRLLLMCDLARAGRGAAAPKSRVGAHEQGGLRNLLRVPEMRQTI